MDGLRLTRRKFLQKTITAGSAVSVAGIAVIPGLQAFDSDSDNCSNCGFQEKRFVPTILQDLFQQHYCPHCGVDSYSSSFPIDKRCACKSIIQNTSELKTPPCCQVPFPTHGLANSTKPTLRMADLQF